jgi:NADH-quinone oxidoreductase subunit F
MPVIPGDIMMGLDMDYDSLSKAGSSLGSGGIIVMDHTTCMVKALMWISHFYAHESCGQCTPCREGTGWMARVIHRIEHGHGKLEDLDLLEKMPNQIAGHTICAFGEAAAWPVLSFIKHYKDEFIYHIENKKCKVVA